MNIPDGYAQLNLFFTGVGAPTGAQCTLGINATLWEGTPEAALTELLAEWNTSTIMGSVSDDITLSRATLKFGPVDVGPTVEASPNFVGGASTDPTAPQTAFLIKKITGFGGRAGRGRMYLPGCTESQVQNGGTIAGATVTGLNVDFEAFRAGITASALIPVVLHNDGSPLTVPSPILQFLCDSRIATQRRRNRR